jgi:hypothetical protein
LFKTIPLALVVLISVSACARFPVSNPDPSKNNKATFNKDLSECKEDYPEASSGINIRQWEACMNLKGWK